MKRALTMAALLLACVACEQQPGSSDTTSTSEIEQIESTLDAIESELAGD
ncbi:hypothetical protein SAMN05192558_106137 [Actinokineospora alba]|uniref:Uncharacterized protein n=1 Tax=Actinokineospora alba TaxID=504798 RepID=A0A1H0PIN4_9PSEU|nr:hypothetical protein [Actinokineospora alba]TDP65813.1 hypothetical protein C8E96_1304 [Actinokineospora alba]SDI64527.1 hypothetical protein SAMN05421871_106315 [Actinokineospora alba]SDP04854.1 hypothetical protein SAMN05192558_106137 [Actinokineospora alba]